MEGELVAAFGIKICELESSKVYCLKNSLISDIVRGTRTVINFEHLSKIAEALQVEDIRELIDFE